MLWYNVPFVLNIFNTHQTCLPIAFMTNLFFVCLFWQRSHHVCSRKWWCCEENCWKVCVIASVSSQLCVNYTHVIKNSWLKHLWIMYCLEPTRNIQNCKLCPVILVELHCVLVFAKIAEDRMMLHAVDFYYACQVADYWLC